MEYREHVGPKKNNSWKMVGGLSLEDQLEELKSGGPENAGLPQIW